MATLTKTRKPVKAIHGSCRWLRRLWHNTEDAKSGLLEISATGNTKLYGAVALEDRGQLVGYRLIQADGTTYDVDADTWVCSCPDAIARPDRPGGCRHVAGLRAALAAPVK